MADSDKGGAFLNQVITLARLGGTGGGPVPRIGVEAQDGQARGSRAGGSRVPAALSESVSRSTIVSKRLEAVRVPPRDVPSSGKRVVVRSRVHFSWDP